ncbi:unnamed protein product [Pylaiella littoralis]
MLDGYTGCLCENEDSSGRKPSQQSHRIQSRRALRHSAGPRWTTATVRHDIKRAALAYTTSRMAMLFLAIATLSSCLFYILATYLGDFLWVRNTETAYGTLFLVDYILTLIASPVPMTYFLSKGGLTDLVSTLPAFGSFQPWMASLAFVRYLRVGKAIRVIRNHQLLTSIFSNDDVSIKATLLIVKVVGVVMMTSAILYGVERGLDNDDPTGAFNEPGWQWHDAFYFTIVTLSTVGYGDILPVSDWSRIIIAVVIIFALTYIPLEVNMLVEAINARPKNRRGFPRSLVGSHLHVVLALAGGAEGADGEFACDMLERCVAEFFDKDQTASNVSVWVVIMANTPPSEEISALCRQPKYRSRVVYFRGSVTNPRDMAAVCAEYADCIFLFPSSPLDGDIRAAEERTHLAAKAVRRYIDRTPVDEQLMDQVKVLSQTGNPQRTVVTVDDLHSKDQLMGFGIDHVICLNELKLSMLASATLCPAFLPFVANCVRSCENSLQASSTKARGHLNGRHLKEDSKEGQEGAEAQAGDWLDDYTAGTDFEIYSVPLEVISEDSSLWNMSFSRAARTMYDESQGKMVMLAVVEHVDPSAFTAFNYRARRTVSGRPVRTIPRTRSSGTEDSVRGGGGGHHHQHRGFAGLEGGGGRGMGSAGGAGSGGWGGRHQSAAAAAAAAAGAGAHVEIFPDDEFRFTIDCHLLVLAENQTDAEDLLFKFQSKVEEEAIVRHPVNTAAASAATTATAATTAGVAPLSTITAAAATATAALCASDAAPVGGDHLYSSKAAEFAAAAVRTAASAVFPPATFGSHSSTGDQTVGAAPAASGVVPATTAAAATAAPAPTAPATTTTTTSSCSSVPSSSASNRPPNVVVSGSEKEDGRDIDGLKHSLVAAGVGSNSSSTTGGRQQQQQQQYNHRHHQRSRTRHFSEEISIKALSSFQSSPSPSQPVASGSRHHSLSRHPSVLRMNDETKEELDTLQKEVFHNDEVDWMRALDALKQARLQLGELDLDKASGQNPPGFFDKVAVVSRSISDALRMHTASLPPALTDHIVLVGGNACLQYYILALRRQWPLKPIVVVTEDTASFFELRDRLVECKFFEMSLNINQIYHVFGRTQDRFTLEEANVAQAESVMLMSDENNDTAVLLGSFELEQVLEEMPPGELRPKVLIDLSKDDSIYYCGSVLGGSEDDSSSFANTRNANERYTPPEEQIGGGEDVRYWPLFAAGRVWTTSIMDVFAVRTYFNAHVLSFFEILLQIHTRHPHPADNYGGIGNRHQQQQQQQQQQQHDGEHGDDKVKDGAGVNNINNGRRTFNNKSGTGSGGGLGNDSGAAAAAAVAAAAANQHGKCQFAHLRVSASFEGRTYGDLTHHLIAHGAMPLGLYRASGTKGSTLAYTHINPAPHELLKPWPPGTERRGSRLFYESSEDEDMGEDEEKKDGVAAGGGGGHSVAFEMDDNGDGDGPREKGSAAAAAARAGDDVFVLRSKWCTLPKEGIQ